MKMFLAGTALAMTTYGWAAAEIPHPDDAGKNLSQAIEASVMKESDVKERLNSLSESARKYAGFKEANKPLLIYQAFKEARTTLESNPASPQGKASLERLYTLAREGFPSALNYVGTLLDNGRFVQRDSKVAARYFYEAAKRGDVYGKHNYAIALIMGRGVAQNTIKGIELLKENSARRMPYSAVACGIYYETLKEYPAAINCYSNASGFKEHPIARTRVGILQMKTRSGAEANLSTIKASINQAAKLWWPEAQWTMVDMERYGIGGKPDAFQTAFWLRILQLNPNARGSGYEIKAREALGGIQLDEPGKRALEESIQIWLKANPEVVPVVDYTKSVSEKLY